MKSPGYEVKIHGILEIVREVILHEWIRSSGITEFKDVNESLGKTFSFSKMAGAFADISAGNMRIGRSFASHVILI